MPGAVIHWPGNDPGPACLAENPHGAGHMAGRGDQQPDLIRFGLHQIPRQHRILMRIARLGLINHARARKPEAFEELSRHIGFRQPAMHKGTLATGEDNARIGETSRECHCFRHALSRAIDGGDAARIGDILIHRAPQHHNTINPRWRFSWAREAVLQGQQNELADGRGDQQEEEGQAGQDQPAAKAAPAPDHGKPYGANQQREMARPRRKPQYFRNYKGEIGHDRAQTARSLPKQRRAGLSSEGRSGRN